MDNENNIVLLKLYCGDYIIGEVSKDETDEGLLPLDNPRIFGIMPGMSGGVSVVFQPVCLLSKRYKKHVDIRTDEIMCRVEGSELDKELINGYRSEVTGIKIASAAESAIINDGGKTAKGGDFVL